MPLIVTAGDPANPAGVVIGRRVEYEDGEVIGHVDRVIVRPAFRGRTRAVLRELYAKGMALAAALGIHRLTAAIEHACPRMLRLASLLGFVPYVRDDTYTWVTMEAA